MDMKSYGEAIERFTRRFDRRPDLLVTSPGRVNLIGAHADYNQGFVLPIAIDRSILFLSRRREEKFLHVHSTGLGSSGQMPIDGDEKAVGWLRYPAGVLRALWDRGYAIGGVDLLIDGDLPMAAGLGSSAALEVGFLYSLNELFGLDLPKTEMIAACHRVENEFVGMRCGVMDQFMSAMGRAGNALFLDCRDMSYEYIGFDEEKLAFLLFDSGVKRELVRSGYNTRRQECTDAVSRILVLRPDVRALRDLSPDDLPWLGTILTERLLRRSRHVITEIHRVTQAKEALQSGDLARLGELVATSHISLRDDFEVSCTELDQLFNSAIEVEGVYGARLTGAGFGGNLLVLCRPEAVQEIIQHVSAAFCDRFGRSSESILCRSADGVSGELISDR